MKKYFLFVIFIALVFLGVNHLLYATDFYLPVDQPIQINVRTEKDAFQLKTTDSYQTFIIKAVDVTNRLPYQQTSDYTIDKNHYYTWLEQIADMGANTIRVLDLMDEPFYQALSTYNTNHTIPLYLIQGIDIQDRPNEGPQDAFDDSFLKEFTEEGRMAIDIVHGHRTILLNNDGPTGTYRNDVSQWVIGYLIGNQWNADNIIYTDHRTTKTPGYQGTFFTTSDDASLFETVITTIMDQMMLYENNKYHQQTPIGVNSAQNIDFLKYKEVYGRQLNKYATFDPEHILCTTNNQAGTFAGYIVTHFTDNYAEVIEETQRDAMTFSTDDMYHGYLNLVHQHTTRPLIDTGVSFSTSRVPTRDDTQPMSEQEQGEGYVEVYRNLLQTGWAGMTISAWQDSWQTKDWNNAYATDLSTAYRWHNVESQSQNRGILAFSQNICQIDGKTDEWQKEDILFTNEKMTLSVRHDSSGIYLLVQGASKDSPFLIPIDVNHTLGTNVFEEYTFANAIEFVLKVDGYDHTDLYVQQRYNSMYENFAWEVYGENPFIHFPDQDTDEFSIVQIPVENTDLIDEDLYIDMDTSERLQATLLRTFESGHLVHGNHNPSSTDYNSLADFCFGEDCVEIRIPWELLNVYDPSVRTIHDDYYTNYGVVPEKTSGILFSVVNEENPSSTFYEYRWKKWLKMDVSERLKQSYYILQKEWRDAQ